MATATNHPAPDLSSLKYEDLKAELVKRKDVRIAELEKSIKAHEIIIEMERIELSELTGIPLQPINPDPGVTLKPKKGRKKGSKISKQINKATSRKKGGPTAKEAILAVLKKGGTSSKDIVKATGLKSGSVSQALNLLKNEKTIKHDGKKGGLWSLK